MWFNPLIDPFVETGYLGYSLRAVAHRQPDCAYRPSLEIRNYQYASGELLSEFMFPETFAEADAAIERALGKGRQLVDELLVLMDLDEQVES
ncbi:MAG: hypothetical protein JWN94_745 [Betaproteobacteria bacterium]|nr:hypothetical protein [Betaproteobacteria bacterium]